MGILNDKAALNCRGYDMLPYVLCYRNLKGNKSRIITDSGQTILSKQEPCTIELMHLFLEHEIETINESIDRT